VLCWSVGSLSFSGVGGSTVPSDYMCRVLKNFRDCCICSVSERLWRCFAAMKMCGESGVILATFLERTDVSASIVCGSFKVGVEESADRGGVGWK